jgi:hypothetical protein
LSRPEPEEEVSECTGQVDHHPGGQVDQYPGGQIDHHNKGTVSRAVSRANNYPVESQLVFAAWCEATGRDVSRSKLTKSRLSKISARLAEGYVVEDLVDAVRGVCLSPFHMGQNDRGQRYDDIVTVLRDGSQVEKFRDLFRAGPVRTKPKGHSVILSAVEKLEGGFGERS